MSTDLLKTPLAARHEALGAKMVPFAGWHMPVSFSGIQQEHHLVRQKVGLFDASHMGLVHVTGKDSVEYLQKVAVNDATKLIDGMSHYSAICKEDGTCIDDIYTVRVAIDDWYIVVNAGTKNKDMEWLQSQLIGDVKIELLSTGLLSLQGPKAVQIMQAQWGIVPFALPKNGVCFVEYNGEKVLVTRTGYTGEDGFELFPSNSHLLEIHDLLLRVGAPMGIQSCGLGCRDTLRLESGFSLYGHELNESIDLVSAGLSWIVGWDKPSFIGKEALLAIRHAGASKKIVGLLAIDKAIPREGMKIENEGVEIGYITSGGMSPILNSGIALAYLNKDHATLGSIVHVRVRDQLKAFRVQTRRFVGGK